MIILFTDFGLEGPYIGQMKSVLYQRQPGVTIIDLFSDVPAHDTKAASYLLAAYSGGFPPSSVFLCVIDPGVGTARPPVIVNVDDRWYVGPDNGLFNMVARYGQQVRIWDIICPNDVISATFHGRDVFAPAAAKVASGELPDLRAGDSLQRLQCDWPDDYPAVIYIDHYGNAFTGIRAASVEKDKKIIINNQALSYARTYNDVAEGQGFWYENANGLLEIAVNQGRAVKLLNLNIGDKVAIT